MVCYTELSPTGSEISGIDRQSEIVAAIESYPFVVAQRRKSSMRAGAALGIPAFALSDVDEVGVACLR